MLSNYGARRRGIVAGNGRRCSVQSKLDAMFWLIKPVFVSINTLLDLRFLSSATLARGKPKKKECSLNWSNIRNPREYKSVFSVQDYRITRLCFNKSKYLRLYTYLFCTFNKSHEGLTISIGTILKMKRADNKLHRKIWWLNYRQTNNTYTLSQ